MYNIWIGKYVRDGGCQLLPSCSMAQVENILCYLLSLRELRLHCSAGQKMVSGVTGNRDAYSLLVN